MSVVKKFFLVVWMLVVPCLLYGIVNFVLHEWVDFNNSVVELAILQGFCWIFCLLGVPLGVGRNKGMPGHITATGVIIALILAPVILAFNWIVTLLGGIFWVFGALIGWLKYGRR